MSQLWNELAKYKDNFFGMSSSTSDLLLGYNKLDVTTQTKVLNLTTCYQLNKTSKCVQVKLPHTPVTTYRISVRYCS